MKSIVPLLAAALVSALSLATAAAADQPRLSVVGVGEEKLPPDMALLSLSVMREAPTARDALTANNDAMAAVISAMKASAIAERDLQTAGVQIAPRYDYTPKADGTQEAKLVAYQVTNTLSVRVRDLGKTGEILDKAVALGVNQGGGIVFTNDDPSKALTEARKKAVADALAKAGTLAEASGVSLGRILEINEAAQSQPPQPVAVRYASKAANSVPVESGKSAYRVEVSVTWELR